MKFYSSINKSKLVDFRQALWDGLAPGGGLYCPVEIPFWKKENLDDILQASRPELATEVIHAYISDVIDKPVLHAILNEGLNFDIPLKHVNNKTSVLELFHGPTEAFKDVGARFMARMMSHFLSDQRLTILVATSGDTGSAVADGFWQVEGIDVIVLFPKGGVSPFQESQMTTLGHNITAVEVEGTFDDCQDLVKRAFQDQSIKDIKNLSSANSINIGRLLPQSLYYYFIAQQSQLDRDQLSVCVPSGNFGNITSGLYANMSGLNFGQFVAATNSNNTFPEYISTGKYLPKPSVPTLSNAMDVGKPSNFERIMELFDGNHDRIKTAIKSVDISDTQTIQTMKKVYINHNYLLDPHAAVGWTATECLPQNGDEFHHVILGTAHPRKFEQAVHLALPEISFNYPDKERIANKIQIENNYSLLKSIILG